MPGYMSQYGTPVQGSADVTQGAEGSAPPPYHGRSHYDAAGKRIPRDRMQSDSRGTPSPVISSDSCCYVEGTVRVGSGGTLIEH